MCKISINNMLWLALITVIQNKHLPMHIRQSMYASVCVTNYTTANFFPLFFLLLQILNMTPIAGNFKANNGYILANFRWKLA